MIRSILILITLPFLICLESKKQNINTKNEAGAQFRFDIDVNVNTPMRGEIFINQTVYTYDLRDSAAYDLYISAAELYRKFIPGGIN